jgi:hypothetical protein
MSDKKPIIPRGQPTLGKAKVAEKTVYFKFAILESHHAYILSRAAALRISAAEYLRQLIEADAKAE